MYFSSPFSDLNNNDYGDFQIGICVFGGFFLGSLLHGNNRL